MTESILTDHKLSRGERRVLVFGACGVIVVVFALLAMFVLAGEALTRACGSQVPVQHTREVIENLQKVLSTLQDAETGERGYVITGKQAFLGPFQRANEVLNVQLA